MSCCTSNNFCMQMWPHQSAAHNAMGCPRVNAGKWHVVLRQLLHADVTSSKLLPATQEAAPPHIACGPSPAVLARSLQSSRPLPANIDFPVNFHATHVQHTCNTRATHVQHTCNTTCNTSTFTVNLQVRLPFLVCLLQSFFVSIWKRRSACNGKKTQFYL